MPNINAEQSDAVDRILKQWQDERPDLDCRPMGPIGRIKRCSALLEQRLEMVFETFSLSSWEFDMLAALRRAGAPYCLSPTDLFSTLMVTSGTMTHRLKRLESREFIIRLPNALDARSMLVQLSNKGKKLIDEAVEKHVVNERLILAALSADDLEQLDRRLASLLRTLE
ncbi:MarR family transcriptional regulator [Tatumella sp. TA1]|nr:MarR family transcriptional regulator [Tatumella sp. TA1]